MGFLNPNLITRLDIDPQRIRSNALLNQRAAQQNQIRGTQIAQAPAERNYLLQQRRNDAADRQYGIEQRPALALERETKALRQIVPSLSLDGYTKMLPQLQQSLPSLAGMLPTPEQNAAEAAQRGITPEENWEQEKLTLSGGTAAEPSTGGLTPKNTQEVEFYDEEADRWMVQKQRYNPATGRFETYSTGPKSAQSQAERQSRRLKKDVPRIQSFLQRKGPMATYGDGYKVYDDGTLYLNAQGEPVKLPSFEKVTGKRGNIKALIEAGNQLDDGIEVIELLQDPEVQADLRRTLEPGVINRIKNMGSNKLRKWAAERGLGENTKSYEVLIRLQRMASEERKRLLGAAVTTTELASILSWMPDAGDNFDSIVAKMNVGVFESFEGFKHWLDVFKDNANMSPFYKAFGWDRFNMPTPESFKIKIPGQEENQSPVERRGAELEELGFPDDQILDILRKEFSQSGKK